VQTKKGSIFEICCNVFSGLVTAYLTWCYIMIPISVEYGWDMNKLLFYQICITNICFTIVSIIRGYFWRRLFNWLGDKGIVK